MKRYILFALFCFVAGSAFGQYPANPNKIRLGNQTSGDGLVYRGSGAPAYTPTDAKNAWVYIDSVAGRMYTYRGGAWEFVSAGAGVDSLAYRNDSLFVYSPDTTFYVVIDRTITVAGTSGTPQTVDPGQTLTIAAGNGVTSTAGATRTVTVAADTGVLASKTYLTNALVPKLNISDTATMLAPYQRDISLTTTGTSGAATFSSNILNIPQYQAALTNPVTGTGTSGYVAKFTGTSAIGNSIASDDGTRFSLDDANTGTAKPFRLDNWTTAARPAVPSAGDAGYNTTLGLFEGYGASSWLQKSFPAGTTSQTIRHDGTSWLASSVLTNNGTNITSTGAFQGTTFANTNKHCANPSGAVINSSGAAGALEIKIPVWSTGAFYLTFQVRIASVNYGNQLVNVAMYAAYTPSIVIYTNQTKATVSSDVLSPTSNVRFGDDGTNIIIWIEELGRSYGNLYSASVENVTFHPVSATSLTPIDICSGWVLSFENSAFNTVQQTRAFTPFLSVLSEASSNGTVNYIKQEKPILAYRYLGNGTFATQISLPDSSTTVNGDYRFRIRVGYNTNSLGPPKEFFISAYYSYSGRTWSNVSCIYQDGSLVSDTVRFGYEGTKPVIYIGSISTSRAGFYISVGGLETFNVSTTRHSAFLVGWDVTTETSAYSNVTVTRNGVSAGTIPFTTTTEYSYSNNLYWDNANSRFAIGNTSPQRTFHVTGEARITDLTTDTPTRVVGADADGDLGAWTMSVLADSVDNYIVTSGVSDGDKGDIDVTSSGATWTIDTNAVTTVKINAGAVTSAKLATGAVTGAVYGTVYYVPVDSIDYDATTDLATYSEIHYYMYTGAGATANQVLTVPAASSTYAGKKIYVVSDDADQLDAYGLVVTSSSGATIRYYSGGDTGFSDNNSYASFGHGEGPNAVLFVCVQNPRTLAYRWVAYDGIRGGY